MKKIIIPRNEKKELKIDINDSQDYFIIVEENAELNLLAVYALNNADSKINFNLDLKENSKLNFINLQKFSAITNNNIQREVKLERNSVFNLFDLNFGSKLINSGVI